MPMVNGKKYPYTGKGMMDAAAAKKKSVDMPEPGGKGSSMTPGDRNKARDAATAKRSALKQRLIGTGAKMNKVATQTQNRKGARFVAIGGLGTDPRQNQRDYDARTKNLEMLKEKNMPKSMNGGSGVGEKTGMKSKPKMSEIIKKRK